MTKIAEHKIFGSVFHCDIPKYLLMRTKHICDVQAGACSPSCTALQAGVWVYIGMELLLFQGEILQLDTAEKKNAHIHTLDWNLNLTLKFLSCWKEQILLSNTVRTWLHIQDLHPDLWGDSLVICWIVFVLPFSSLGKVITNPDPLGIFTEFYTDMSSPSKALKHVGESLTLMDIFKLKVKLL